MVLAAKSSDTGQTILPDVGQLSYNGVTFSCLYKSTVEGTEVLDEANRTVKWVQYTLNVEGYVTLPAGQDNTDSLWEKLRIALSIQGQQLTYKGNGFGGLQVNVPGQGQNDVNWGPIPRVLHFQPLGAGRGAMISWQVTFCLPEFSLFLGNGPVAQFNYECTLTYDEHGYAGLTVHGTLEIASTRNISPAGTVQRTISDTVDSLRQTFLDVKIDLTHYRVTRRDFRYNRAKSLCEWEFVAEELPRMGLPVGAMDARGTMSVRPFRQKGYALGISWQVSLRATYYTRRDQDPRLASSAFYSLLWYRMQCSALASVPGLTAPDNAEQQNDPISLTLRIGKGLAALLGNNATPQVAFLINFGIDEGLYLDSKQTTFEATWILLSDFRSLLAATGIWNRVTVDGFLGVPQVGDHSSVPQNNWSTSVQDVCGWRSYLAAALDPNADIIIDFGDTGAGASTQINPVTGEVGFQPFQMG